jgi:hypothetical protein
LSRAHQHHPDRAKPRGLGGKTKSFVNDLAKLIVTCFVFVYELNDPIYLYWAAMRQSIYLDQFLFC